VRFIGQGFLPIPACGDGLQKSRSRGRGTIPVRGQVLSDYCSSRLANSRGRRRAFWRRLQASVGRWSCRASAGFHLLGDPRECDGLETPGGSRRNGHTPNVPGSLGRGAVVSGWRSFVDRPRLSRAGVAKLSSPPSGKSGFFPRVRRLAGSGLVPHASPFTCRRATDVVSFDVGPGDDTSARVGVLRCPAGGLASAHARATFAPFWVTRTGPGGGRPPCRHLALASGGVRNEGGRS